VVLALDLSFFFVFFCFFWFFFFFFFFLFFFFCFFFFFFFVFFVCCFILVVCFRCCHGIVFGLHGSRGMFVWLFETISVVELRLG